MARTLTTRSSCRSNAALLSSLSMYPMKTNENPTLLSPPKSGSTRPKKTASVTPKRFARFFTPRSSLGGLSSEGGRKRNAEDETGNISLNTRSTKRRLFPVPPKPETIAEETKEPELPPCGSIDGGHLQMNSKAVAEPNSDIIDWFPAMSSPCMRHCKPKITEETEDDSMEDFELSSPIKSAFRPIYLQRDTPAPAIKRFGTSSMGDRRLLRECGVFPMTSARNRVIPVPRHSSFISSLCSTASDVYHLTDLTPQSETVVPFSMTTTIYNNTEQFTVIGDSTGCVQIIKNNENADPSVQYFWRAHENAITAVDVSGPYLATASSDRTSRVLDFETGKTIVNLANHESALRNIKFRPSDPHILMTSSRDGTVNIWDIRHKSPVITLDSQESSFFNMGDPLTPRFPLANIRHTKPIHSIIAMNGKTGKMPNTTSRSSITALQWLPYRDHLFLSASEVDATITLWDSRYISKQYLAPLSRTALPTNDPHYCRAFGITSLSLSSDGTRLYSTCRNSSIYTYSIPHLILGEAPELSDTRFTLRGQDKTGLGPLFSMRCPALHIDSFWIKSSILPSQTSGTGDILAVGNTAIHPILFPVDENLIAAQRSIETSRYLFAPLDDKFTKWDTTKDGQPLLCITNGVALRSGLEARSSTETTAVAWQADGGLVTVDDESNVRFWRHDEKIAEETRRAPVGDPVHFTHGYADIGKGVGVEDKSLEGIIEELSIV